MTGRRISEPDVMRGYPVPSEARISPANVYEPPFTRWFMQHVREVERTAPVGRGEGSAWELPTAPRDLRETTVSGGTGRPWTLAEMLTATSTDALAVVHGGAIVYERYFGAMTPETPHMYQSVSKSVAACVAASLMDRGILDADAPITSYVPELAGSGYAGATVRNLLDMQVGVRFSEDYEDEDSDVAELDRLYGVRAARPGRGPGSSYDFAAATSREGDHGKVFRYVSLNVQVLGWAMERATGVRVPELIARELWSGLGTEHEAYVALDGAGSAQLEGGFCSSLRDLARFGLALCRGGEAEARQVVPRWFIEDTEQNGDRAAFARGGVLESGLIPAPAYRNNFWTASPTGHTVFMGLGIYGQFLYVNRSADLVVAKFATHELPDDPQLTAHDFMMAESLAQLLA